VDLKQQQQKPNKVRIIVISDSHNTQQRLAQLKHIPDAEILLHCGDFTEDSTDAELTAFNEWLGTLTHIKYRIVICGNHEDKLASYSKQDIKSKYLSNATHFLQDDTLVLAEYGNLVIHGTPYVPNLGKWESHMGSHDDHAYYKSYKKLNSEHWNNIPSNVNILMTHTPPYGILDGVTKYGCYYLTSRVVPYDHPLNKAAVEQQQLETANNEQQQPQAEASLLLKDLQVHCFGHIHMTYGHTKIGNVTFV